MLEELKKHFEVDIVEYIPTHRDILNKVAETANYFRKVFNKYYDLVLIRGDRFEVLPIAMLAKYKGMKIAHLEGGDLSGAIDNKVRYALTALSDIHFCTNKESFRRLISMGTDPDLTFNFGSLDVEYAKTIMPKVEARMPYVVMCHHAMDGEDPATIEKAIRDEFDGKVIVIKSNSDSGNPYGKEEFSNEEYIKLIAQAKCLVGNSSSFLKEASIFGTPVVNVGNRQVNRLKPDNVKDVPFDDRQIRDMIKFQLHTNYFPSDIYYQEGTSKKITEKIKKFLK